MKTNGRICERIGKCSGCGFKLHLSLHRKAWLCRGCLVGVEVPLRLEDFVVHTGAGLERGADEEGPDGLVEFGELLTASMRRVGIIKSRAGVKELMAVPWFAGRR